MKKINSTLYKITFFLFFILSGILSAFSQDRSQSFSDLFQSNDLLNIRLEADFKNVFKNTDDTTNFAAVLSYFNEGGQKEELDLKIRTRGVQRRVECNFMPIKWEFKKKKVKGSAFEKQKEIKLVTHCRKQAVYEQNTILEYLVYRALNIITDSSFRVRPMMINYVYTGKKIDSIQRFGFIIERFKYMAERLNMMTFKKINFHSQRTNIDHMNVVDVFQYMIGNTDYSVFKLHNVKLIMDTVENRTPLVIPFDFDWCGLVAASYAIPNPMFGTKTVVDRIYRGFELNPLRLQKVFDRFNVKRSEIFELFANEPLLKDSEKKRVKKYLEGFYRIINKEGAVYEFIKVSRSLEV